MRNAIVLAAALCEVILLADTATAQPAPAERQTAAQLIASHDRALIRDLKSYAEANPNAPDREQAFLTIFETVIKNDWFKDHEDTAARYLIQNEKGAVRPLAHVIVVMAKAHAGRFPEALREFDTLISGLDDLEQRDFVASFAEQLTTLAVAAGDIQTAKAVQSRLLERYADDVAMRAEASAERARLELVGKPAPDLTLRTIDGQLVSLSKLRGRVVLIDFWATYCLPWQTDLPSLRATYDALKDSGVSVIGVSLDDDAQVVADYARSRGLSWPLVHNASGGEDAIAAFGVRRIPASVLIDRTGTVVRLDARGDSLRAEIERLTRGSSASATSDNRAR